MWELSPFWLPPSSWLEKTSLHIDVTQSPSYLWHTYERSSISDLASTSRLPAPTSQRTEGWRETQNAFSSCFYTCIQCTYISLSQLIRDHKKNVLKAFYDNLDHLEFLQWNTKTKNHLWANLHSNREQTAGAALSNERRLPWTPIRIPSNPE